MHEFPLEYIECEYLCLVVFLGLSGRYDQKGVIIAIFRYGKEPTDISEAILMVGIINYCSMACLPSIIRLALYLVGRCYIHRR